MILTCLSLALCLPLPQETGQTPPQSQATPIPAALTADHSKPSGVLHFSIRDKGARLMPGRLTFVQEADTTPSLFPGVEARPDNLAVRYNVIYCLSGEDTITVPVGEYTIYAGRGIEWSLASSKISILEGEETEWHATLEREVHTAKWISGDFHLHTLTHSGHGDANMKERIISLIGEGVEFAVATDHNHNTDYVPTIAELEAEGEMAVVTGNEISTPIGHINAFPLDPDAQVIDAGLTDANELFKLIRQEVNDYGVEPVIQLNHPRWGGIDFFTLTGLDPITGRSDAANWSGDFDTIELLNENEGWGYHDADTAGDLHVGAGLHSVLQDWYNLLNLGHKYYVVGNSDSHTVHHAFAGYPRNFIQSSTDNPSRIKPAEIASALKAGRSFTTLGPFIEFKVNGTGVGEIVRTTKENIAVTVKIQAPSWIYLNRVKVVLNGDIYRNISIEPRVLEGGEVRWPTVRTVVKLQRDSWIHVIVEGDESLAPIVTGSRPIMPLAISNPIWIQTDNDASQTSTWTWALSESATRKTLDGLRPSEAAMVLQAGAWQKSPTMPDLVRSGLNYGERRVQLAALRAMEKLAMRGLNPVLLANLTAPGDAYRALTLCRTLKACGAKGSAERLLQLFERYGSETIMRYKSEVQVLLEGQPVVEWKVVGHFASPAPTTLFQESLGPEKDSDPQATWEGKSGPVTWRDARATESGYLDLYAINPETATPAISFAQTWLHADQASEVIYALGSDDGCRMWVNGGETYRDETQHAARPLGFVGRMPLNAGWNRVLIGVENGGGPSGLYFRVLSPGITNNPARP